MVRVALKNLWAHKLRTVLLGLAVVAGVAFVSASYVFTDSLGQAFEDAFAATATDIDITVTPAGEGAEFGPGAEIPAMEASVVEVIAATEGVEEVVPFVQGFVTLVVDEADGSEQPTTPSFGGSPTFAISWAEGGSFQLVDGRAPGIGDEALIDAASAETRGIEIGDTMGVATSGRAKPHTVVGTFGLGEGGLGFGATFVAFTLDNAQSLLGMEDEVSAVDVNVAEGASVSDVLASLESALPEDAIALDARAAAAQNAQDLQEGLSFFNIFLLVFGGISLVVGAFVVYNAFRVVVAQRSRELALLRILGTTRRQLRGSVLGEALIVGIVASSIGVLVGLVLAIGVRALLSAIGGELPDSGLVLAPRTVLIGLVVGTITTVASAFIPAVRATRISPMEALADQPELRVVKKWWAWVGGALAAIAVVLVSVGAVQAQKAGAITGSTTPVVLIGIGCFLAFVSVFLLARSFARPVLAFLGGGARSTASVLGRENARRTPRRTAVTASALMIGLGLVATVAVLSRSVEDTILRSVEDAFASEILIQPAGFDPTAGFSTEVGDVVAEVDGVSAITRQVLYPVDVEGAGETLALGVQGDSAELATVFESIDGDLSELGPDSIAVQKIEADGNAWAVGDTVSIEIDDVTEEREVVAIFQYAGGVSDSQSYYLAYEDVIARQDVPRDVIIAVQTDPGVETDTVVERLDAALADFPSATVATLDDLIGLIRSGLNALVGMVAGLLFMSVVVAVVGIVLTLYLAVFERTRETGLLRAVGMTRRQVRRMIRFESILIALFGTLLGLGLGLFCGWALSVGVVGEGVSLGVPWIWIGAGVVAALVAGVLAAIVPAAKAARLDVIEAIGFE